MNEITVTPAAKKYLSALGVPAKHHAGIVGYSISLDKAVQPADFDIPSLYHRAARRARREHAHLRAEARKRTTKEAEAPKPEYDNVNHPPHYKQGDIECIDAIRAALTPQEFRGYCKGNMLKYVWCERHKGGDESVKKAQWYGGKLLECGE